MPRETLELPIQVKHLSILSEDGDLDEELEPELDDDTLRAMYRAMVLARRFDERMLKLQRGGEIGTFAPVRGQEAAQVGAVAALEDSDWMVPAFREIAALVWRGLPNAVPVASQIPHAAGIAYAAKVQEDDDVVPTFFPPPRATSTRL